jgi:hypothetical protein
VKLREETSEWEGEAEFRDTCRQLARGLQGKPTMARVELF